LEKGKTAKISEMKITPLILAVLCSANLLAADSKIIAPGATLQKLAGGFKFTEGPACDGQGNVFFTDLPNDRILKWSVEGRLSTYKEPSGRANGLCFDRAGNLWVCAEGPGQLWRIDPAGKVTVLLKDYQGKRLNGPNDVWVRPDGGAYFTDPFYDRAPLHHGPKEMDECVYYISPEGRATRVIADMKQPNGLIGASDGKTLYVSDLDSGKTYRYCIQPDGSLTDKQLFCNLGSDGMTLDDQGNVYLTGKGVTVFDSSGKQIEHIAVPQGWTGNVCFGGKDRQTLFITACDVLHGLRMQVKGVGSQ
jgi:gluconolactonase